MSVTYTKEQKMNATREGKHLVTVAAGGLVFQEAVSEEEQAEAVRFLLAFRERCRAARCPKSEAVARPLLALSHHDLPPSS